MIRLNDVFNQPIPVLYRRYIEPYLPYLIVAAVLLASALLAQRASQRLLNLLVGGVGGIIGGLVLLRRMQLGLLAVIPASLLVSQAIGTGTNTSINATILILAGLFGVWIVDMVLFKRQVIFARSASLLPVVLLIIVSLVAYINGQLHWFVEVDPAPARAQFGGLMVFVLSGVAFLLAVHLIDDIAWLKRMTWLFIAIGAAYILIRITPAGMRFTFQNFAYGSTMSIFWLWMFSLVASQALFNSHLKKEIRIGFMVLLALMLYQSAIQAYDWKSGWVPAVISVMAMVWIGFPKLRFFALPASALILGFNAIDLQSTVAGGEDYSMMTRLEAWRLILEMVQVNPFLGLGPANYYWYTPLFPILGYSVVFNSHNNYIDILAQVGIFGLVFFMWWLWEIGKVGLRLLPRAPVGFERAYVIGALGGLAGTLVAAFLGDWVIPFVYNVGLIGFRSAVFGWLFLGGLVALGLILDRQQNTRTNNPVHHV
jgi:hypothetical protein